MFAADGVNLRVVTPCHSLFCSAISGSVEQVHSGNLGVVLYFISFILAICELRIISFVRTNAGDGFCFELEALYPKNLLRSLVPLSGSRPVVMRPSDRS